MLIKDLKIIDVENEKIIGFVQWIRLEAAVSAIKWKAMWERKRKTLDDNVFLLRSTDLTEVWYILDTCEGELEKVDYIANEIHVKNYKLVTTKAGRCD